MASPVASGCYDVNYIQLMKSLFSRLHKEKDSNYQLDKLLSKLRKYMRTDRILIREVTLLKCKSADTSTTSQCTRHPSKYLTT